jgi:hypothetical protein
MGGEDQRRLSVVREPQEAIDIRLVALNAPALGMFEVEIPQPVEIGEFGAHAAEIVPARAQNPFNLRC